MRLDLSDEYMDSSISPTSSPTRLWSRSSKKHYNIDKTPLGIPIYCWILLGVGLGLVVLGSLGLYLVGLGNGPRVLYLKGDVEEPADFEQCSFGQCTEFFNCRVGPLEKIKTYIQPIVEVVDKDGAAVSSISEEFLAIRRALQNYVEPVESPEQACITIPGVDFLNLMKLRSGEMVQKVIEAVQRDLNGARTNILLFNNIGMIEKMHYKVIWASAELTSKQFRTHFDISIPPLRPYYLHSADAAHVARFSVKKAENRWIVYARFAAKNVVVDMERILNLFQPNVDRLIFAADLPTDKFNMTHVIDSHSNEVFEYGELLTTARFTIINDQIPGYQLAILDALQAHSIPVIISDDYVYPFGSELEWKRFSVRIPRQQMENLVVILNQFDPKTVEEMRSLGRVVYEEFMASPERIARSVIRTMRRRFSNEIVNEFNRIGKHGQEFKIWRDIPIRSLSKNVDVIMKIDQQLSAEEFDLKINKTFKLMGEKLESLTVLWPENMRPYELDSLTLDKKVHLLSTSTEEFMGNIEDSVRTLRSKSDVTSDCWMLLDGKEEINVTAALFDQAFNVWKENADQVLSFNSNGDEKFKENIEPPFYNGVALVHPYVLSEIVKTKSQVTCSHTPVQTVSCAMSDSTCEKLEVQMCRPRSD